MVGLSPRTSEAGPPSPWPTALDGKRPSDDDEAWLGMTHLVLETRPTPGQITDLAARPQHESGDPHPRFDAPPESLGGTMRFHRRGIYAHAAPHSLGSISRASTPLRALSTRKAAEPREMDIGNKTSVPELP